MLTKFEAARRRYKPAHIVYLLVAEAPPREGSGRFFYFENVKTGDSLFLEVMKVLYYCTDIKKLRLHKKQFLGRLKNDGFYLIDSTDKPIENPRKKRQAIEKALPSLRKKLQGIPFVRTFPAEALGGDYL